MKNIIYTVVFLITITVYSQEKKQGKVYRGWTYIDTNENGENYYKAQKNDFIWYKLILNESTKIKGIKGKVKIILTLYKVDCKEKEIGYKSGFVYDNEYNILQQDEQSLDIIVMMEKPKPNSIELWYLDFYCNNIKR